MKEQTAADLIKIYSKRAKHYNSSTIVFYNLLGLRVNYHRRKAVEALNLKNGDTIVEIGCGTGGNFPILQIVLGKNGKIIGVDLSDAMLKEAKRTTEIHHWNNV